MWKNAPIIVWGENWVQTKSKNTLDRDHKYIIACYMDKEIFCILLDSVIKINTH